MGRTTHWISLHLSAIPSSREERIEFHSDEDMELMLSSSLDMSRETPLPFSMSIETGAYLLTYSSEIINWTIWCNLISCSFTMLIFRERKRKKITEPDDGERVVSRYARIQRRGEEWYMSTDIISILFTPITIAQQQMTKEIIAVILILFLIILLLLGLVIVLILILCRTRLSALSTTNSCRRLHQTAEKHRYARVSTTER